MTRLSALFVILLGLAACDSPNPAGPSGPGYAGEWSGQTFQGRVITFTVSAEQKVTAISVSYSIDSCSGSETFQNLDVPLIAVGRGGFGYDAKLPNGVVLQIQGYFITAQNVSGGLLIYGPPACGTSETIAGPIQATKR